MIEKNESMNNIDQPEKKYLKGGETRVMNIKKKAVAVLSTSALLASLASPVFADSKNVITRVPSVDKNFSGVTGELIIREENVSFHTARGQTFRVILHEDAEWNLDSGYVTGAVYKKISDQILEITIDDTNDGGSNIYGDESPSDDDEIRIPLDVTLDGASGELQLEIDSFGSTITSGKYTFAVVGSGKTTAFVDNKTTISEGKGQEIGDIRIDENYAGALPAGKQKIQLRLPTGFEWSSSNGKSNVSFSSALDATVDKVEANGRYLDIEFTVNKKSTQRGSIFIKDAKVNVDDDDKYGDVTVTLKGDNITSQDLVVATYSDYGVTIDLADDDEEVPTLFAGRNNEDTDDLKLAKIKIKENVVGSIIDNRTTTVKFPSWVKVVGVEVDDAKNLAESSYDDFEFDIKGDSNEVDFRIPAADGNKKREFTLQFYVSIEADKSGDITAEFSGRAGVEGEVVVGKAVTPVTASATAKQVRVGVKGQEIGNIEITESAAEAIKKGTVVVTLEDGEWTDEPKVEVVEGDLEIDEDSVEVDGPVLTFDVDGESAKASKIKISGGKIDLYRDVPEGNIEVKIGGSAIVQNDKDANRGVAFNPGAIGDTDYTDDELDLSGDIDVGEFDKDYVAKVVVANVATPAPATTKLVFTIGSKDYTVNNETKTFEVAPFIDYATERTYLPVRAVAEALGASIYYDDATRTVTLVKDGKAVTYKNGGNSVNIAGTNVPVKVINKEGYTFLPFRLLAEALGAKVEWDATNRQVIVTQ